MTDQVGVTHEIILNGRGFRIKPPNGSYSRYRSNDFAPRISTGDTSRSDLDGWQTLSLSDWSGGSGLETYSTSAKNYYYEGDGAEARIAGHLTLGALTVTSDASFIVNKFIDYASKVYALGNTSVRVFDPTLLTWTDSKTGLASAAIDAVVFGVSTTNWLLVGLGDTQDMYKFDGATWTALTGLKARALGKWRGYLWRAWGNSIAATADLSTWGSTLTIGGTESNINALMVVGDLLVIFKDNAIFTYDGTTVREIYSIPSQQYTENFKNPAELDGYVYFGIQGRVKRNQSFGYSSVTPQDVTPTMGATNDNVRTQWGYGIPVGFASSPRYLFAAMKQADNSYSYVLSLSTGGAGWHPVYKSAANTNINCVYYSRVASKLFINDGSTSYQAYNSLAQSITASYATSNTLVTGWFNAGFEEINKGFKSVSVAGDGLSTTEKMTLYYELDHSGTWVLIGDVQTGPQSEIPLSTSVATIVGKTIRFKFVLSRGADASKTPDIRSVTVAFLMRPQTVYAYRAVITIADNQADMTGAAMDDFFTQYDALMDLEDSPTPISFDTPDQYKHSGYLTGTRVIATRRVDTVPATIETDVEITLLDVVSLTGWKTISDGAVTFTEINTPALKDINRKWNQAKWNRFTWG